MQLNFTTSERMEEFANFFNGSPYFDEGRDVEWCHKTGETVVSRQDLKSTLLSIASFSHKTIRYFGCL